MTKPAPIDALAASSEAPRTRGTASAAPTPAVAKLFSAALDKSTGAKASSPVPEASVSMVSYGSKSGEMKPEQQFEGFMLRSFIESMLPSENSSFYGEGTAGGIWKSMLAERIGDEMAKAGGIGIADMIGDRASVKAAKALGDDAAKAKAGDAGALAFRGL